MKHRMRNGTWYWRIWWWFGYHGLYQLNWWLFNSEAVYPHPHPIRTINVEKVEKNAT